MPENVLHFYDSIVWEMKKKKIRLPLIFFPVISDLIISTINLSFSLQM